MLTSDLVRPFLVRSGFNLSVQWLDEASSFWQQTAGDLITLFQQQGGQTRAAWESALVAYEGDRTDYLIVRGLAKVLTDAASFAPRVTTLSPSVVRRQLFERGPIFTTPELFHPHSREEVVQQLATPLGASGAELDAALFADRAEEQVLVETGPDWTPAGLLARYNLELARGVLYTATVVHLEVYDGFKDLWKYLKLFQLMFWGRPLPEGGYRLDLAGPISPFVQSTTRYGRAFAAFLPAVLLCERWQLAAEVRTHLCPEALIYRLDSSGSLRSSFKASGPYDSRLEREFAEEFTELQEKFGSERNGWQLEREREVLLLGDTVMIPDFVATHTQDPSRRLLIELVGYWTPTYLRRKVEKVRAAGCRHLLLLVYQGLNLTEESFADVVSEVLFFPHKPVLKDVLAIMETMAEQLYGPLVKPRREPAYQSVYALLEHYQSNRTARSEETEEDWLLLSELAALFTSLDPLFTPRRYGHKSLSALVKAHPDLFETRRHSSQGRPIQVRLCAKHSEPAL